MKTAQMAVLLLVVLYGTAQGAESDVVINEIMYHPPGEREDLQFVELHNRGGTEVDLSRWSFSQGLTFAFPEGTRIGPGGYLVVARNSSALLAHYGQAVRAVGNFTGKLSHSSERIELANAARKVVDWVKYGDGGDWPRGADGYSASLERISPFADGSTPVNWASSPLPRLQRAAGTPGRQNSVFATNVPPAITAVQLTPQAPKPGEPVRVEATVADPDAVGEVKLFYRTIAQNRESPEAEIKMERTAGDDRKGNYLSEIQAQPQGTLVRFRIAAWDTLSGARLSPSTNDPAPTFSYYSFTNTNSARISFGFVTTLGAREPQRFGRFGMETGPASAGDPSRGNSTFVYVPPGGGDPQVFDHVRVSPRHGGFKVRFLRDQEFKDMSVINVISEGEPRWMLCEPLSYELYRLAGVPAPLTEHIRVWRDGQPLSYQLLVEQPNRSFLERNSRDTSGTLYKLLWYGNGLVGQHEKKTNKRTGHQDLTRLMAGLTSKSGEEQWRFIEQNFNVPEMINYFAVNMCIQNWDGFFNNYFTYHDTGKTGKWEIYPWDEDKTWGAYDGASPRYDWYELPLTFGMNGSRSPSGFSQFGGGPFGGVSWWRPPGHFSGPLLANPRFRKKFLERLKEICETVFTEERFLPVINGMENRLEDEPRFAARFQGQSPEAMARRFKSDMQSFRNQLVNRRKFILAELQK